MTSTTDEPRLDQPGDPNAPRDGWLVRMWRTYVTDVARDTNAGALEAIGTSSKRASDLTIGVLLLTATVCLIGVDYLGRTFEPQWLQSTLRLVGLDAAADQVGTSIFESDRGKFWGLLFWSAVRAVFTIAVPLVVARVVLGIRPRELGLRVRGILRHATPYVFLYFASLPVIVGASFGAEFEATYPFYDPLPGEGIWPYLVTWWLVYGVQFIGVEIFYRGFLVLGLAPRMGIMAVFVSVVPYVMIHFDKPLPETFGAIITGVALGFLALKYRSIWWGAALHIATAVTFDVLALWHEGFF